jgi:hypothetical protein
VCAWQSGWADSRDSIPGCASCKDEGAVEPYLNCSYSLGPGAHVNAKEGFTSFRVMSLALDSDELERQALSNHRTTQLLAPHTTENPVFFHATDVTASGFKATIDQVIRLFTLYWIAYPVHPRACAHAPTSVEIACLTLVDVADGRDWV